MQEQLHVKPGSFYASPSGIVASSMNSDVSKSVIQLMPSLLSSMPVLLYQGSEDYIVNVAGVDAWINSCQWSGLPEWQQQERHQRFTKHNDYRPGKIDVLGYVQQSTNLTYVLLPNAGHFATADLPAGTQEMVQLWLSGDL